MVLGQDPLRFGVLASVDEPARGLGDHPEGEELDSGHGALEADGEAPGEVAGDVGEGAESCPCSEDGAL